MCRGESEVVVIRRRRAVGGQCRGGAMQRVGMGSCRVDSRDPAGQRGLVRLPGHWLTCSWPTRERSTGSCRATHPPLSPRATDHAPAPAKAKRPRQTPQAPSHRLDRRRPSLRHVSPLSSPPDSRPPAADASTTTAATSRSAATPAPPATSPTAPSRASAPSNMRPASTTFSAPPSPRTSTPRATTAPPSTTGTA